MAEHSLPEAKARPSDTQIAVRNSATTSAVVEFQDPRELPLEERLQQCTFFKANKSISGHTAFQDSAVAEEHDEKLKHIMETVPIKIRHLQGSSAGAGSGEFHIYRNARNQEQKRLREMEARWKAEQEKLIVKRKYEDAQQALDTKTAKNRAKRQKRKGKKHVKAAPRGSGDPVVPDADRASAATQEPDLD